MSREEEGCWAQVLSHYMPKHYRATHPTNAMLRSWLKRAREVRGTRFNESKGRGEDNSLWSKIVGTSLGNHEFKRSNMSVSMHECVNAKYTPLEPPT